MIPQSRANGFTFLELLCVLSLGILIFIFLLTLISSVRELYHRQLAFSDLQENVYFLSNFFREKIQMAGNWSCQEKPLQYSAAVRIFNANDAKTQLNIKVAPATNLLQLSECIRFHHKTQFLPIYFFDANSGRADSRGLPIDSLFMQIDHHRREELISGVSQWNVTMQRVNNQKINQCVVEIRYVLTSMMKNPLLKPGILYVALRASHG